MVLNINTTGEQISLSKGKYKIDLIGGWGIKLNGFTISFKNVKTVAIYTTTKSFWPTQGFWEGRRCKRIFNIDIEGEGLYEVVFSNTDSLVIRHSPLRTLIHRLFAAPISNENLKILIQK